MSNLDPATSGKLGGIKAEIIVAEIFSILAVIGWVTGFIYLGFFFGALNSTYACTSYYGYNYCPQNPYITTELIVMITFIILMILPVLVLRRTGDMRKAANEYEFMELKNLNSIGWAIVALLFAGVIPGIMLLVAHGPIEEFGTQASLSALGGRMSSDSLRRLTKLKALLDSGVITKDEYEAQKNALLHPDVARPAGAEDELRKLKILYDSGALTAAEYEDQKKKVLSGM